VTNHYPAARLATPGDLESIVELLAVALDHDPLIDRLVRPDAKRPDAVRRLLRESARRYYLPHAASWVVESGPAEAGDVGVLLGAALCLPPGAATGLGLRDSMRMVRQTIRIARLRGLWRAGQTSGFLNYIRPRAPHVYVSWLGASGAAEPGTLDVLLAAIVAQADEVSAPAYAEAASEQERSLMAAHGFDEQGSVDVPGGPELSLMWRRSR
jgi:hypothetical protein